MSKKIIRLKAKKSNHNILRKKILVPLLISAVFIGAGLGLYHVATFQAPVKLDDNVYGEFEAIDISKDQYETMIKEKKSFAVLVDSPTCVRSKKIEQMMNNMDEKYHFKYYRMMWADVKQTSLFNYVKFLPSLAVINKGHVRAWLKADKDEDKPYFSSQKDLQQWLEINIYYQWN